MNGCSLGDSSFHLGVLANELALRVVTNELKFQNEDHARWAYQQEKAELGKKQASRIIETKDGDLGRLLSINGQPLAAKQLEKENQRDEANDEVGRHGRK